MGRRSRIRRMREEDLEELLEQESADEKAPAKAAQPDTPVSRALELQKTAGNRATGAALQRWPFLGFPQAVAQWPRESQLILDDTVIPLESYADVNAGRNTDPSSSTARPNDFGAAGEVVVTIAVGDWSTDLNKAMLYGKHFKTVQLVIPAKDGGVRWILTDVLISALDTSSGNGDRPLQTLQLNFKKREFSQSPPPPR